MTSLSQPGADVSSHARPDAEGSAAFREAVLANVRKEIREEVTYAINLAEACRCSPEWQASCPAPDCPRNGPSAALERDLAYSALLETAKAADEQIFQLYSVIAAGSEEAGERFARTDPVVVALRAAIARVERLPPRADQ